MRIPPSTWTPRPPRSPAAGASGSPSPRPWSRSPTCFCSTSRPTISTSKASSGLKACCARPRFACVVVSHDRYFLENVATEIVELNRVYAEGLLRVQRQLLQDSRGQARPTSKPRASSRTRSRTASRPRSSGCAAAPRPAPPKPRPASTTHTNSSANSREVNHRTQTAQRRHRVRRNRPPDQTARLSSRRCPSLGAGRAHDRRAPQLPHHQRHEARPRRPQRQRQDHDPARASPATSRPLRPHQARRQRCASSTSPRSASSTPRHAAPRARARLGLRRLPGPRRPRRQLRGEVPLHGGTTQPACRAPQRRRARPRPHRATDAAARRRADARRADQRPRHPHA